MNPSTRNVSPRPDHLQYKLNSPLTQTQVLFSQGPVSRVSSLVSRDSTQARELALRLKCQQEGFELVEVSYYYKNGKKKKRVKKKKKGGSDCPRPKK